MNQISTKGMEKQNAEMKAFNEAIEITYGSLNKFYDLTGMSADEAFAYAKELEKAGKPLGKWGELLTLANALQVENAAAVVGSNDVVTDGTGANTAYGEAMAAAAAAAEAAKEAAEEYKKELKRLRETLKDIDGDIRRNADSIEALGHLEPPYQRLFSPGLIAGDLAIIWANIETATDLGVQAIEDSLVDSLAGPNAKWKVNIESTFADMLGKGFAGEFDSFKDLWDEIWQDLAKSMTGILTGAFENWMNGVDSEGNASDQGLFSGLRDVIGGNRAASLVGGLGMVYSGYQQGGGAGMAQGAMGGAMAGASIGLNPAFMAATGGMSVVYGAVAGAIVGAAAAYFGGPDTAYSSGRVGLDSGYIMSTSGQELGEGMWAQFSQDRVIEYRKAVMAMNDVLRLFDDASLFDMIRDAPTWEFDGRGSLDHYATIFREQWLPEAMRQMFTRALGRGLGNLGMTDTGIDQLFTELQGLGTEWVPALRGFVLALKGSVDLLADMDWNTMMDESKLSSFESFFANLGDVIDAVGIQMLGLDDMTLLERADQAQTINDLMLSARQAEIQMLQQLNQLQKNITRSLASQIEGIQLGGMSAGEKTVYYTNQIQKIMATLRSGTVTDPDQLAQLIADLQRYAGGYQQSLGESFYNTSTDMAGRSFNPSEWIIGLLSEAGDLSTGLIGDMEERVREQNERLITALEDLIAALTGVTPDANGASAAALAEEKMASLNVPVEVVVNIAGDKSLFIREVRSIVHAEMRRTSAGGLGGPHGVN
jgi:hypothetical protein